ncbi:MAG: hypothetical protein HZB29_11125 [Nitrospinae bacterium]|nr:hypothetical protein [Nitrospinota bacterium]
MTVISPKLGEFLLKTTGSSDMDNALRTVFSDYIELKTASLDKIISGFREKWKMDFSEFKEKTSAGDLGKDPFSHDVEKDFWEWEEAQTLKEHYETLKAEWI